MDYFLKALSIISPTKSSSTTTATSMCASLLQHLSAKSKSSITMRAPLPPTPHQHTHSSVLFESYQPSKLPPWHHPPYLLLLPVSTWTLPTFNLAPPSLVLSFLSSHHLLGPMV